MATTDSSPSIIAHRADPGAEDAARFDAVVVGASIAGCATAIHLGRAGLRVALVEKSPDPAAFKRTCSHFIQASAVPAIERLELMEPMLAAGALRPRVHAWTGWGWIEAPPESAGRGINLRREVLDPMLRETAGATPGVTLMPGRTAERVLVRGDAFAGVAVRDRDGAESEIHAALTVGADGRDSSVARLAGVRERTHPHGRVAYGAYYEGADPPHHPDATIWMMDPQWAATFPTDSGLTFYAAMVTKDRLPEFKRDPERALVSFLSDVPEPPPIREAQLVGEVVGKIEMTNRVRQRVAPGLALVGDAALATDPLFGIGCGWALQSAEWLAEAVTPALRGEEPLGGGLNRYRRRHKRELAGHAFFIHDYATGRRFNVPERLLMSAACENPRLASAFDAFATRRIRPGRMLARTLPRSLAVGARRAARRRPEVRA
jgi:2-polyprenyl-6-methoxyphenol hydroxylase-like FAD-dependent oxidoreductase